MPQQPSLCWLKSVCGDSISILAARVVVNGHGSHGNGSWGACSTVGGVAPVVCQVMNLGVAAAGLQQLEGDWLVGCGSNDAHAGLRARSTLRVGC